MKGTEEKKKRVQRGWRDYLLVMLQLILLGAFAWGPAYLWPEILPKAPQWLAGIAVLLGALLAGAAMWQLRGFLSPFPTPSSRGKLLTGGVFGLVRHPIYSGLLLLLGGFSLYQADVARLIITGLLLFLFYIKSRYEERQLKRAYPGYAHYRRHTGRFLPRLPRG